MPSSRRRDPRIRAASAAVVLGLLLAAVAFAGAVLADDHTRAEAPHYEHDETGNATFEFLEQEDHSPGAENVSVRYTLKGGEAFDDVGASDGIAVDRFVVETDAVDHSDCAAHNIAAFGVDRGDDGSSGGYDVDLLKHTGSATFTEAGVAFEFYDYEDLGGDPPVVAADDRIVLELSDESSGGGCADTTGEIGFYNANAFLNGTGPREADRDDETYGFTVESEYTYVCECEDEEEARERIGPPPAPGTQTETPSETATATATPTSTQTGTEQPKTPTPGGEPILTATLNETVGNTGVTANASVGEDGVSADVSLNENGAGAEDGRAVDPPSPTPAEGPGFGAGVAVATLLGSSLLARRRLG
ncbi:PGF-CTERM sorting domain-containing protein [Natronomonas salina]|uniref:PGF-CTERM sorting domain-containing protein n=1 Tax=Natronomonas salina TaxID=1710540 RepID=UPI0015B44EEA|nr:PGF-CTERM sorting domain-containing protein [Natronomonas salina]QLD90433.1 PGF-CTERM sorting domain-containing protein [Natronomonas salina]